MKLFFLRQMADLIVRERRGRRPCLFCVIRPADGCCACAGGHPAVHVGERIFIFVFHVSLWHDKMMEKDYFIEVMDKSNIAIKEKAER